MSTINVKLKDNNYNIYIERNILDEIGNYLNENYKNKKIAIITDNNLKDLYIDRLNKVITEKGFETKIISITPGEQSKNIDSLKMLYDEFAKFSLSRKDLILAFGGGVVGDLTGFAASTYLRGIPYIQIPTSLLAQVDSSIGGKVAIDLPFGKNLVGSFYHPKAVFIDPNVLKTLDKRFLHDGLAEVIKYGCIKDKTIIDDLMSYKDDDELLKNIDKIIHKCCRAKRIFVEADEKDFGERMILNFGHTLGHAIEMYYDYSKYTHGEAVAIGMAEITKNTEKFGITKMGTFEFLKEVLNKYKLPYKAPKMNLEKIYETINLDKKSVGEKINLIMINKMGESMIKKVSFDDVKTYLI